MPNRIKRRLRVVSIVLASLVLLLTACASAADADLSAETTQPPETTAYSTVESITLAGEAPTKTVFTQTYARYEVVILRETEVETTFAELGEVFSAAEDERDAVVEMALDVTLIRELTDDLPGEIARRNAAGTSPDLLEFAAASTAAAQAASGYLADLDTLGSLNADNPALDAHLNAGLTVAGHSYFLFGDATAGDLAATAALLVDTAEAESRGIRVDELTDAVRENRWTTETLLTYSVDGTLSLDGDDVLPIFVGGGGKLFVKDEQDVPTLTPGEAFSRAYAAMQTVMAASTESDSAVFTVGTLGDLRDGVLALPMPTVNAGDPYRSAVDAKRAACISVPTDPADPVRTGDVLTAYFEASTDTVMAKLYAHLPADVDSEMLSLILDTRECLLGTLFGWGDLADALIGSVGMRESEFLDAADMRMTAAARAMEIFLNRLK